MRWSGSTGAACGRGLAADVAAGADDRPASDSRGGAASRDFSTVHLDVAALRAAPLVSGASLDTDGADADSAPSAAAASSSSGSRFDRGPTEVDEHRGVALMLQVSKLIEDDPKLAAQFATALRLDLDVSAAQRAEEVCERHDGEDVAAPARAQLQQVGMAAALPFLGFGILDNGIMIACGDMIDVTLCATFGFSTMAAAALGNTFSDAIGVCSGGFVEDVAMRAGFEAPPLSRAQQALDVTKKWERFGQLIGITTGCLIGMFPLLLIDPKKSERLKREKSLNEMYEHVVVGVEELLDAEAAMLMLVDEKTQELYTRSAAHHGDQPVVFRSPIGEGIMGHVARAGRFLNIQDLRAPESREFYNPQRHDNFRGTGIAVRSVLCMPIFAFDEESGHTDKVVGVVEVINKKRGKKGFTEKDEDALAAVSSHISSGLSVARGEEHGFNFALEVCRRALWTKGTRINVAQNVRVHDMYVSVLKETARMMVVDSAELLSCHAMSKELVLLATNADEVGSFDGVTQSVAEGDQPVESYALTTGAAAQAASTRQPVVLSADGPAAEGAHAAPSSGVLCCPIFDSNDEVIGVLQVSAKADGTPFSDDDVQFLKGIASQVSNALEGTGSILNRVHRTLQDMPSGNLKQAQPVVASSVHVM